MKNNFLLSTIVLCLVLLSTSSAKSLLVIESYHSTYAWDASYLEGLKTSLKDYTITTFEMNTKRIDKGAFQKAADDAWKKYKSLKPDMVVIGDDNALKLLGEKFKKESTPVVYLGINGNPKDYGVSKAANITGVLERPLFKSGIMNLTNIVNDSKNKALILFDNSTTSQGAKNHIFIGKNNMKIGKTSTDIKLINSAKEYKETVKNAKKNGYSFIVLGLYHTIKDAKGNHVPAGDILAWCSKNSPIPTFGFWDFSVGKGKTAGGLVLYGKAQGERAAKLIKKIEKGAKPGSIFPEVGEKGKMLFSKSELKRWGITLPKYMNESSTTLID